MKKITMASLALLLLLPIQWVSAAPKSDLWPHWEQHNPRSTLKIDHQSWSDFLGRYLQPGLGGVDLVRYGKVTDQDRLLLAAYVNQLQSVPISLHNRAEQFAYWVNLYNARTVLLILEHFPVDSIRDITYGWFSFGPWDEQLMKVEGQALSLNDIEHRILRPLWQDNRIHYAVNCASMGCPNLALQAYTANNSEQLLDKSARDYVNHSRGVQVLGQELRLSEIYRWYRVDFAQTETGLLSHLKRYAGSQLKADLERLLQSGDIDFEYDYDWSLNISVD